MNPYVALAVCALLIVTNAYTWVKSASYTDAKWELKAADNRDKAKKAQDELQEKHDADTADYLKKLNGYRVFTDALIVSLSSRSDRPVSGSPRPDCTGATGAELSRPDSEFLARQAERAEGQREGLIRCYADYDRARAKIIEFNKKVE